MAVFTYSEETIQRHVHAMARRRNWIYAFAAAWLTVDLAVALSQLFWPAIRINFPTRWGGVVWSGIVPNLFTLPCILVYSTFKQGKSMAARMEAHMRSYSVDVSPYSIRAQSDFGPQRQFARDEIVRVDEPSWGKWLILRSHNRYHQLAIPRLLDGTAQLKDELRSMGIPFERTVIPGNWEEIAMAVLFFATILCSFSTQNRQILIANLIIAILAGIGGFLILGAKPDGLSRMRWVRFVAFLPAVFSGLTFFL
jgi:hypothetical protein